MYNNSCFRSLRKSKITTARLFAEKRRDTYTTLLLLLLIIIIIIHTIFTVILTFELRFRFSLRPRSIHRSQGFNAFNRIT